MALITPPVHAGEIMPTDSIPGALPLPVSAAAKKQDSAQTPAHPKDLVREVKETIVFVVVLVLLLKLFVAEAFVIPTGSMAETLRGDHVRAVCPQCAYPYVVNNAEGDGGREEVHRIICPNCGYECMDADELRDSISSWHSGDRVLVSKFTFSLRGPERFDVPVFKYPIEPYSPKDRSVMNYIKRLVGLPGETIAVYKGDLYRSTQFRYERHARPAQLNDYWAYWYMYRCDPEAVRLFKEGGGGFEIVRKRPDQILAMRRIVFDLDHLPKRVTDWRKVRWQPSPNDGAGWALNEKGFAHTGNEFGWMRYQ